MFDGLPQEYVDQLEPFGHIIITEAWQSEPLGDHIMDTARYTGVVDFHSRSSGDYDFALRGMGIEWWLGTPDKAGDVLETAVAIGPDADFDDAIRALLPDSITEGALVNGTLPKYTGTHQFQTRREAIDYVCETVGAVWRVNPNGSLDAGAHDDVFGPTPTGIIVKRQQDAGDDMTLRAFPGPAKASINAEDYASRVVILGKLEEDTVITGSAELDPVDVPYKDLNGNPMVLTRLVSESATEGVNADARAAAQLAAISTPRTEVNYDTGNYDMRGTFTPGAKVWVYDPEAGIEDSSNEITFRGQRINPVLERVTSIDWPITDKMGVYYRSRDGEWIDLTRWLDPVDGQTILTNVEIGSPNRPLLPGSGGSAVGRVPTPDTSVPGVPTFVTPFVQGVYLSDTGETKAQIQVVWTGPTLNTDGTAFEDGSHFEIRFRPSGFHPGTWDQAAAMTWDDLGEWQLAVPQSGSSSPWQNTFIGIDQTAALIQDLTPGVQYEFQIRAVDAARPPNAGAWSSSHFEYALDDATPPPTPATPEVAGALTQISVLHRLGSDAGGTFNLPLDLAYLEVHASTDGSGFTPDEGAASTTRLGKIEATRTQIGGNIPVIGSFPVATTAELNVKVIAVDQAGNRSSPSAAAAVTAELIPDEWIINLTADKITAGSITASIAMLGEIYTGVSPNARVVIDSDGIRKWDSDNVLRVQITDTEALFDGKIKTGNAPDSRVEMGTSSLGRDNAVWYDVDGEAIVAIGQVYSAISPNPPVSNGILIQRQDASDVFQAFGSGDNIGLQLTDTASRNRLQIIDGLNDILTLRNATDDNDRVSIAALTFGGNPAGHGVFSADASNNVTFSFHQKEFLYFSEDQSRHGRIEVDVGSDYSFIGITDSANATRSGFEYDGSVLFCNIRSGSGLQVVNESINAFREVKASAFTESCGVASKEAFQELPASAMSVLRDAPATRWRYQGDPDGEQLRVGPVAEQLPEWLTIPPTGPQVQRVTRTELVGIREDGTLDLVKTVEEVPVGLPDTHRIDLLSMIGVLWTAVRELDQEFDDFRRTRGVTIPTRRRADELIADIQAGRLGTVRSPNPETPRRSDP